MLQEVPRFLEVLRGVAEAAGDGAVKYRFVVLLVSLKVVVLAGAIFLSTREGEIETIRRAWR
jgi:hypothetical protein